MKGLLRLLLAGALAFSGWGQSMAQGDAQPALLGKHISVFGDSYVANHRRPYQEAWHCLAARELGMTYQNVGRNGSCVAWDRTAEGFGPSMLVRYKQLDPEADLVLIIAGHNDAGFIGHSRDSLAMFRDSLSLLIDRVRSQCPHARVAWVTPWRVDRAGFRPLTKTLRRVCRSKGVAVLNNARRACPIKVRSAAFRKQYFQGPNDTAHLNAAGHQLMLADGKRFIEKVMR